MILNGKLKSIGRQVIKYTFFLVAVMAWMIVLGPKETLTAEEQSYVQEFIAQVDSEPAAPTQVASETVVPTMTEGTPSDLKYGIVLEDSVNIRKGPGVDFPAVMQLFKGNEVQLVEELVGGWWKVSINGTQLYIKSEFVSVKTMTGSNQ
ncbi:hypothetical protein DSECCO2_285740 [anaerobic digester metagenome]